jgi:hypothetical protein
MKKPSSIALLLLVPIVIFVTPSTSAAQQPKMDIKLFVGGSATTFVSMLESGRERETFAGWQIGFGPRVRRRHAFIEILFSFNRWAFAFSGSHSTWGTSRTRTRSLNCSSMRAT